MWIKSDVDELELVGWLVGGGGGSIQLHCRQATKTMSCTWQFQPMYTRNRVQMCNLHLEEGGLARLQQRSTPTISYYYTNLVCKLVAWKAQYLKGLARVLLHECIQGVVLRGVASEGGEVHHEQHAAAVRTQRDVHCLLCKRSAEGNSKGTVF